MPARHHRIMEYEMGLAEEMLAQAYVGRFDPGFRRFVAEVFGSQRHGDGDELLVRLWDASEAGRLCGSRSARAALRSLMDRITAVESELGEAEELQLGLLRLAELAAWWVRPVAEWDCPDDADAAGQFGSLIRHLLAAYPMPAWMDALLLTRAGDGRERWFVHVARGGNLRSAPGLPLRLTKRMAHLALETGEDRTFFQAVRRGQVLGFDGSEELAREVGRTWLGRGFERAGEEEWWSTVFLWMAPQRDLEPAVVGPLLDYLQHQKRREPGLRMKGRAPAPLIEGMEQWHRELRRRRRARKKAKVEKPAGDFSSSGLRPGLWRFGAGRHTVTWRMEEILTRVRLWQEGSDQCHCVGSYEGAVRSGRVSIWSLRIERTDGLRSGVLTLEVDNGDRRIVQARGRCNRRPNDEELRLLRLWAQENALRIDIGTEDDEG